MNQYVKPHPQPPPPHTRPPSFFNRRFQGCSFDNFLYVSFSAFSHKQMRSTGEDVVINTSRSTLRSLGTAPSMYRFNPWCYRLDWLLFNLIVTFNPIVTILYWLPVIVNRENFLQDDILNNLAIVHLTIVNTALIYLDLLIRRIPVRLVHSIYPMALWVIYMAVNAVVHVTIQTGPERPDQFLYTFYFNWDAENVAPSIGYALAVFFGILGLHLLAFLIFELRKGLFLRCCKDVGYLDETDYSSEASFQMTSGLCCSVCGRGRASHDVAFH